MYENYRDIHFNKSKSEIKETNYGYLSILISIIVALFIYIIADSFFDEDKSINNEQNNIYENKILQLIDANDSSLKKIYNQSLEIKILENNNRTLNSKISNSETIINNLKIKYEKANNFTRNYTSDSIINYMSTLK